MEKWIYTCKNGKGLRRLIDEADVYGIISQLKKCYEEILNNYPWEDEWDKDAFEELLYELEGVDVGLEDYDDFGYDDEEDLIDSHLANFYDACDELRIWVEV